MKKYVTKNQRIADLQEQNRRLLNDIYTLIDNKDVAGVYDIKYRYEHERKWQEVMTGTVKAYIDFFSGNQKRPTDMTVGVYVKNSKAQMKKLKELKDLASK